MKPGEVDIELVNGVNGKVWARVAVKPDGWSERALSKLELSLVPPSESEVAFAIKTNRELMSVLERRHGSIILAIVKIDCVPVVVPALLRKLRPEMGKIDWTERLEHRVYLVSREGDDELIMVRMRKLSNFDVRKSQSILGTRYRMTKRMVELEKRRRGTR